MLGGDRLKGVKQRQKVLLRKSAKFFKSRSTWTPEGFTPYFEISLVCLVGQKTGLEIM